MFLLTSVSFIQSCPAHVAPCDRSLNLSYYDVVAPFLSAPVYLIILYPVFRGEGARSTGEILVSCGLL